MNITILDGYTTNPGDLNWDGFATLGKLTVYDRTPEAFIIERAQASEILLTNKTRLTEETLMQLPKLKYIGVLATGYDVVNIKTAEQQHITVTNIPSYGTDSVAQHVFALLLELTNQVGLHNDSVKKGEWAASEDWCYSKSSLTELAGKTMGIIGFGRIGRRTAEIASAFGMKVKAYSPSKMHLQSESSISFCNLEELLSLSDIISLHCPLTKETRGLINRNSINLMKSTAFIINTSRGPLVVEKDLSDALIDGRIAGAALDVLTDEPPSKHSALVSVRNCILTPHIAWASKEARLRLVNQAVENLRAFIEGKPINEVYR